MREITVKKEKLLEALTANRETHQADFDLAYEGFRAKAVENMEAMLERVRTAEHGTPVQLWIGLEPPVNHLEDYDRAIQMCSWEIGDEMTLTEREFQELVQDDWSWKAQVLASNKLYTGSESPSRASAVR